MKQNLETVLTFSQLTHKSRAYLWRPCDVWMHYLMFNLGDASLPSDIWLLLITAEIILQPTEIGYSCDFAWWLKPTAWIWTLQQGGPTLEW